MGFYSASQLIQDVRRHSVEVRPICVIHSQWDHVLEADGCGQWALRLGMRLVASFNPAAADRIVEARQRQPYCSIQDLKERAKLSGLEMQALTASDALAI